MFIPPNSTVQLMSGVPFDSDYTHTAYWNDTLQQDEWVEGRIVATFNAQSYVHKNGNSIKLAGNMGLYAKCNYLRFKNTSFENMWFYAFILDMNYINNETFEVVYQIDVMHTWFWEYKNRMTECMVVREHSYADRVGDNVEPENLELGPYVANGVEMIRVGPESLPELPNSYAFTVIASQGPDGSQNTHQIDNQVSGLYVRTVTGLVALQSLLEEFTSGVTASLEPIISINQFPAAFLSPTTARPVEELGLVVKLKYDGSVSHGTDLAFNGFVANDPETDSVYTYIPKNNKLYTYPYNFLTFESPDGSSVELRYELFRNHNSHEFVVNYATYPMFEVMCAPYDYEVATWGEISLAHAGTPWRTKYGLAAKNYPSAGVASDAFSAWWAQNKNSYSTDQVVSAAQKGYGGLKDMLGGLIDTILGKGGSGSGGWYKGAHGKGLAIQAGAEVVTGLLGTAADTAVDYFSNDAKIAAAKQDHEAVPDSVVTKASASAVLNKTGEYNFKVYYTKITPYFAERVDKFFTRYGYAVNSIRIPVFNNRPRWNFIKTNGAKVGAGANIPVADEVEICKIFDKGITFWKLWVQDNDVGDYGNNNDAPIR